ncbi:hypothetical protein VP01_7607g1, partial [Puccinia sorghi]
RNTFPGIKLDLKENSELINYYLSILKIRREEFIRNYQPSHWESLTSDEQNRIMKQKLLDRKTEKIDLLINIKNFLRYHRKRKRICREENMSNNNSTPAIDNRKSTIAPKDAFTTNRYNPENNQHQDNTDNKNKDLIDWGKLTSLP